MKRLFILAALALACSAQTARAQGGGKTAKAEREILALNREWASAMVRGDRAALERIFSDDLIVTASNGTVRGKEGELNDTAGGDTSVKTYFFNTEDVRVRVYGGAAVLTGHAKWRINVGGRDVDHERRYTCVYAREKARWRMVAMQLTRIVPPPQQPQQKLPQPPQPAQPPRP
jgi:ketosteroid isomerase-like protein